MGSFLAQVRQAGFYIKDFLTGKKVTRHLHQISRINKASYAEISLYHQDKIKSLLAHAYQTVPFYKQMHGRPLSDLPVLTKPMIRSQFEDFLSDKFEQNTLLKGVTSGSLGTPFTFFRDREKQLRNNADFIYYYNQGGHYIGNTLYYIRMWSPDTVKKGKLTFFLQNIKPVHVDKLDERGAKDWIEELKSDRSQKSLLTYASTIDFVSKFVKPNEVKFKTIFSTSEILTEDMRVNLSNKFDCAVYSRYAMQETGLIAQQFDMDSELYEINDASYFVEILAFDSDNHVASGEIGRVVITDLFNFAMPFIRYDTMDVARYVEQDGKKFLSAVEGRIADVIFDTLGNRVLPFTIMANMWVFYDFNMQYQFWQNGQSNYKVCFVLKDKSKQPDQEMVNDVFRKVLGQDATIDMEYLDVIEPLPSGKRKIVVNNWTR